MTAMRNLMRHSLSYFSGRLAVLLAGLISLPIMARLLPKEDYGVMSLVFLAITITTSLGALGFPQSTTRYFAEYAGKGKLALMRFCSTMSAAAAVAGFGIMLLVFLASFVLENTESFDEMAVHLRYAVILILLRLVSSVMLQIFRGNQQTLAFNAFNIASRYLSLGVIVLLIVYIYQDVTAVFVGTICVEAAMLVIAFIYLYRRKLLGWVKPDSFEIKRAIGFGMPLVIADLMVTLVASSDRFAIQFFLDADSVAIYTIAYDISDSVAVLFASPLQLAILPIVYSLWSREGQEATRAFLNKAINLSFILVIPMIAGFAVIGPTLVTFLASDKYAESANLVPIIALGVMLGSIHFLLFTGLLLHEKTKIITVLNGIAAVANLTLNMVMIPKFGIIGAAYATVLTYVMLNTITFLVSGRHLKIDIDWFLMLKSLITTAAMTIVILNLESMTGILIVDAIIRTLVGGLTYLGLFCIADSRIRKMSGEAVRKLVA